MIFYISKNSLLRCQVLTEKCNVFFSNFQLANVTKQTPFGNIEALEDYAEKSVSSVYYLTLQCLGKHCTHVIIPFNSLLRSASFWKKLKKWQESIL